MTAVENLKTSVLSMIGSMLHTFSQNGTSGQVLTTNQLCLRIANE